RLFAELAHGAKTNQEPSMRWRGLEPPRGFNPTRPSTLRVYQFRHQRAARIVAAPPRLDICRATIYRRDTYESNGSHSGGARDALARAAFGLRHQVGRRPLDAFLLGGELRADLPGAAAARAGRADRGRGRPEWRPEQACLPAHEGRPRRAHGLALRVDGHDRAPRRVAPAALLRGFAPARGGSPLAGRPQEGARGVPDGPAGDRGAAGRQGPGLRRPGPAVGNRIQRMGCAMVREASEASAEREGGLTEPTFRGVLFTGLPGFLREGFVPLGAFYCGLRLSGLVAGIAASTAVSVLIYLYERRAGRDALLVRISLAFIAVQTVVGLAAHSATVYLAQPVLANAAWGLAFFVSVAIRRPLAGALACAWYPFPRWFRQTEPFKRVYGIQSLVWGAYFLIRSGVRLAVLLNGSLESFLLTVFLTG